MSKAIKLQGKSYMPVAARVSHFRDAHPEGTIETKIIEYSISDGFAVCEATVTSGNNVLLARAQGSETRKDFGDFLEKAGTKAVGRALALSGFGTEECLDLEEGVGAEGNVRIADAPVAREPKTQTAPPPVAAPRPVPPGGFVPIPPPPAPVVPVQEEDEHDPFESDLPPIGLADDAAYFVAHSGLKELMARKVFALYMGLSDVPVEKINQMVDTRNRNKTDKIGYLKDVLKLYHKADLQAALHAHNIHGDINSAGFTELCAMVNEIN